MAKSNRYRKDHIKLYVTENEKKDIVQRASLCEMSNSDYSRKMALTGIIVNYNFEKLQEYIYEINKIGVNINQIAKNTNEENEVTRKDVEHLKIEMIKLIEVVSESAKKI